MANSHWLLTYRRYKSIATGQKFYQVGISEDHHPYKWLRRQFDTASAAMFHGKALTIRLDQARAYSAALREK